VADLDQVSLGLAGSTPQASMLCMVSRCEPVASDSEGGREGGREGRKGGEEGRGGREGRKGGEEGRGGREGRKGGRKGGEEGREGREGRKGGEEGRRGTGSGASRRPMLRARRAPMACQAVTGPGPSRDRPLRPPGPSAPLLSPLSSFILPAPGGPCPRCTHGVPGWQGAPPEIAHCDCQLASLP